MLFGMSGPFSRQNFRPLSPYERYHEAWAYREGKRPDNGYGNADHYPNAQRFMIPIKDPTEDHTEYNRQPL